MKYQFKNTEINNEKASDFETKAMLYLLGMRKDSKEIEYIAIDCFNDVTGANNSFDMLWDVQSKNHTYLPPSKIGESLITLYKNFCSQINFKEFILFIPKLDRAYLNNSSLNIYSYNNIQTNTCNRIETKLKKLIKKSTDLNDELLQDFLDTIIFVEDTNKNYIYVKKLSKFKDKQSATEELYKIIFKEIRDAQTVLKNSYIENKIIEKHPIEVLDFKRHITKDEINTLIINRLIGVDIFSNKGIPIPFFNVIKNYNTNDIEDIIQNCNENLSRAFFDKNSSKLFWKISEFIVVDLKNDPDRKIELIYKDLTKVVTIKQKYIDENTLLYLIALIKEGIK